MHTTIHCTGLALTLCTALSAQTKVFPVSPSFDATNAPSSASFPGLHGAFRQQILVGAPRLAGLTGKTVTGLAVHRDVDWSSALTGGSVDFEVRLSTSSIPPENAVEAFDRNASTTGQVLVFRGQTAIPNSPSVGPNHDPWAAQNTVTISFSTGFAYTGGTLCIDVIGRPVAGKEPKLWYIDHEFEGPGGTATRFGITCSVFGTDRGNLVGLERGLYLGSTMRIVLLGRPGSSPLLMFGANGLPAGIDLGAAGAAGCRQYVQSLAAVGLLYHDSRTMPNAFANFSVQIPASRSLLGAKVFAQSVDLEAQLPRSQWTNSAGFTTSNGLEIQVAKTAPSLGMATVRSHVVDSGPMPTSGEVDVARAPVLRLLYAEK
ncbi:MAG: hypothetical protein H6837_20600 [Planctomycetes bacterium]|nr:hypothetical protein [Planctomycetota bacterium]